MIISQMFSNNQKKNPKIFIFLFFFCKKTISKKDPVNYRKLSMNFVQIPNCTKMCSFLLGSSRKTLPLITIFANSLKKINKFFLWLSTLSLLGTLFIKYDFTAAFFNQNCKVTFKIEILDCIFFSNKIMQCGVETKTIFSF